MMLVSGCRGGPVCRALAANAFLFLASCHHVETDVEKEHGYN
jgi:hypothetical protein